MKCKNCKREIEDNSIFCNWCGERQLKEKSSKTSIKIPSPRKLSSGAWHIQLRPENVSITEQRKDVCIAKAKALRAGFIEAQKKPDSVTLGLRIDDYIAEKNNILSPASIRGYRIIQRRWPELMKKRICDISQSQMQTLFNSAAKKYAPKTLSNSWGLFAKFFDFDIKLPTNYADEHAFLTPSQINTFCYAIRGDKLEAQALLALSSLRLSEICALTDDDIDLEKRIVHVRGAVVYDEHNKKVYKKANKTEKSHRIVPIMMNQLYEALQRGINHVAPNTVYRYVIKVCENNNLPNVGVHGLRHSFASLAAHLQIPERIAMEIGGWSNDKTMKNIYTHTYQSDIKYSENAMSEFYNAHEMLTKK